VKITGYFHKEESGVPVESCFRDDLGRPADGSQTVFPIIQTSDNEQWRAIGTGFFISKLGLFATAKHVLVDNAGNPVSDLAGLQLLRGQNEMILRQIIKIVTHPKADVAIGTLYDEPFAAEGVPTDNKFFKLMRDVPPVGAKVATFAYPKSEHSVDGETFKIKFRLHAIEGVVEDYHPDGRDASMLPGRCFRTSMNLLAGASGGPVAFGNGGVFGVNSTGLQSIPVSFISSILDVLDLELPDVRLPGRGVQERVKLWELVDLGFIRLG
jgi:Trypsin-like peptidase domain